MFQTPKAMPQISFQVITYRKINRKIPKQKINLNPSKILWEDLEKKIPINKNPTKMSEPIIKLFKNPIEYNLFPD